MHTPVMLMGTGQSSTQIPAVRRPPQVVFVIPAPTLPERVIALRVHKEQPVMVRIRVQATECQLVPP